jgi:NAD(P) transhydrogenase subunit alpha
VITTAAVPGRKSPILITREMVGAMCAGSVIVDIAAERGGNCELTQPGETIRHGGVTIAGPVNLPATVPYHASQMLGANITSFLKLLAPKGTLSIDIEDEIVRETLVTHRGKIIHSRVAELVAQSSPERSVNA